MTRCCSSLKHMTYVEVIPGVGRIIAISDGPDGEGVAWIRERKFEVEVSAFFDENVDDGGSDVAVSFLKVRTIKTYGTLSLHGGTWTASGEMRRTRCLTAQNTSEKILRLLTSNFHRYLKGILFCDDLLREDLIGAMSLHNISSYPEPAIDAAPLGRPLFGLLCSRPRRHRKGRHDRLRESHRFPQTKKTHEIQEGRLGRVVVVDGQSEPSSFAIEEATRTTQARTWDSSWAFSWRSRRGAAGCG